MASYTSSMSSLKGKKTQSEELEYSKKTVWEKEETGESSNIKVRVISVFRAMC